MLRLTLELSGLPCVGHPRWRWRQTAPRTSSASLLTGRRLRMRSDGAKRNRAAQSAVDRWANGVDSPCAAQTQPPPTNPERPPSSWCIDVLTESWCAPLHQAVPCAQRQDVVVAHQPGVGGYFTNQFTPARERKCRQLECMLHGVWSGVRSRALARARSRAPRRARRADAAALRRT